MPIPRLRVFAGPNGSGKSTIKRLLDTELIYFYVNADDLEREARDYGAIDLAPFAANPTQEAFQDFFASHPLIIREGLASQADLFTIVRQSLVIDGIEETSPPCRPPGARSAPYKNFT